MKTVGDVCKELGLEAYDTAIPMDWCIMVRDLTGLSPAGNIVWCYDRPDPTRSTIGGYPVAISDVGRRILGSMALAADENRVPNLVESS